MAGRVRFAALASFAVLVASPLAALAVLPAPTGFVASDATICGSISMVWNPVAGADGYEISRDGVPIARVGPTATRYIDYELWTPATFSYCVRAFDHDGSSIASCDLATRPAPRTTVYPEDWFQDVFPSDNNPVIPGTALFARATAKIRTGWNTAPLTGNPLRQIDPYENSGVTAVGAVRVDLIFRILPGPGNYKMSGFTGSGLLWNPAVPAGAVAVAGDASYWGGLMAVPGPFASPGAIAAHAAAPSHWSPDVWNSRQCKAFAGGVFLTIDAAAGTKIIPDDLFTPGTHVEYYYRIDRGGGDVEFIPNPGCVMQLSTQQSRDGHRWEHFGVLPDLWKDTPYGGLGRACLLVVDYDDGGGSEQAWISVADSIGATFPTKYGANNGWHAIGALASGNTVDLDDPANHRRPDGSVGFRDTHGGMPGTTWDYYRVRGARDPINGNAGALGGRLGVIAAGETPPGPSQTMLETYYPFVMVLAGDRSVRILGPFNDGSQNDRGLLKNYLLGGTVPSPRAVWTVGRGIIRSIDPGAGLEPDLQVLLATDLVDPSYSGFSGDVSPYPRLTPSMLIASSPFYCSFPNAAGTSYDVLDFAGPSTSIVMEYPLGLGAAVFHEASFAQPWNTLATGFALQDVFSPLGANTNARREVVLSALDGLGVNCLIANTGLSVDVPPPTARVTNSLALAIGNNPLRVGSGRIQLSLPASGRARIAVFDISGRVRRTIADQWFEAGEHELAWDGADDGGRRVAPGVYVVRIDLSATGESRSRRLIVLK